MASLKYVVAIKSAIKKKFEGDIEEIQVVTGDGGYRIKIKAQTAKSRAKLKKILKTEFMGVRIEVESV
jgi:hypothetical protein